MLAMYVTHQHKNWDVALPYVTFAYNSSPHNTTGYSPFYLLFGHEPLLILDTLLPLHPEVSLSDYASDAICRAEEARQLARLRTLDSQERQCARYDSTHTFVAYSPGDLVLIWTPQRQVGLAKKLLPRYRGPYRILNRTSDVNYTVEPVDPPQNNRHRQVQTVHVLRLKPYIPQSNGGTPFPPEGE